jgi:hypothetical protein
VTPRDSESAQPAALVLGTEPAPAEPGSGPPPLGGAGEAPVVHYHLPVEIEVHGAPEPVDPDALVKQVLLGLARGLANT